MVFRNFGHFSRPVIIIAATLVCLQLICGLAEAERLPSTVRPEHYTITFVPDLKAATFSAVESIEINLAEPAGKVTLNSAEIAYQSVAVAAAGIQQTAAVVIDTDKEQATFTFPDPLPAGKATLTIHFTGILNNELRGFYLSKTARRNYAVTQFESTDARRAFPSFDEPAFKATFDISLVIDAADTAISNSPIGSDTPGPGDGRHTLHFLTTPRMSTYLVAFLVGDFQCTTGAQDGVAIRVCATPDKIALTSYGVDIAKYVLHYYNNYFGIPYPLKKLDLVALPDFEAGAMENFGAITYRETDLLIDAKTASVSAKKSVAGVIAHEMAHQWFGDLVTMRWWDNLWLNEGFANWLEDKPLAAMHPEWNIDQATVADLNGTLDIDAQPTTRAIRAKAETRGEIEQMFDSISYGKASAVLLGVENYVGEETFRKGVHNYLAAHLYSNATAEDFWQAQTAVSHKPVDKIMESLIAQPGAPILTFGEPANGHVSVDQKRFFLSPADIPDPAQTWTLPVCFKANAGQRCELLTPTTTSLEVPAGDFFFPDAAGKGYFRSAYAPGTYAALVARIETGLTVSERIRVIGDEWAQVKANKVPVGDYLNLVSAVSSDSNSEVARTVISGLASVYQRVASTPAERSQLEAWIRRNFQPEYNRLGPPSADDSANTRELRAQLFGVLGYYGKDPAVIAQAHDIAEDYITDTASVEASLGQTALYIAARNGDGALFDKLQHTYETSTNPEVQIAALRLLAQFEDPTLLERSLNYAVSDKVRNQDSAYQFSTSLAIQGTRAQTWRYIQTHWDAIHALLTPELGSVLVGSTSAFCSAQDRDDIKQFFATHKVTAADQALTHSIEHIDGCIELRNFQEPNLRKWLEAHAKS